MTEPPSASPAPVPSTQGPAAPGRERKKLGTTALVLAIVAVLIPLGWLVYAIVAMTATGDSSQGGWAALGIAIFGAYGIAWGAPFAAVAVVLAIVSLARREPPKVPPILALVLATPLALMGLFFVPGVIAANL